MTATDAIVREAAHVRRRDARLPELRLAAGEWPSWLYDADDYPGWSHDQIVAGLTVPAARVTQP